jgi:SAM-dependent methyltransferase
LSLALLGAGFSVTATDSSAEMVASTERTLAQHGAQAGVSVLRADVHSLPFESGRFDLVAGLGLLPWLHDVPAAVAELARVVAPGGWMILSADNRNSLNRLVEPRQIRVLAPLKRVRHRLRATPVDGGPPAYRHRPAEVDSMLAGAGIEVVRRTTVGYGPFTLLDRPVLPDRAGTWLHNRLERASAGHPRLRGAGWHYLVAGKKA